MSDDHRENGCACPLDKFLQRGEQILFVREPSTREEFDGCATTVIVTRVGNELADVRIREWYWSPSSDAWRVDPEAGILLNAEAVRALVKVLSHSEAS